MCLFWIIHSIYYICSIINIRNLILNAMWTLSFYSVKRQKETTWNNKRVSTPEKKTSHFTFNDKCLESTVYKMSGTFSSQTHNIQIQNIVAETVLIINCIRSKFLYIFENECHFPVRENQSGQRQGCQSAERCGPDTKSSGVERSFEGSILSPSNTNKSR